MVEKRHQATLERGATEGYHATGVLSAAAEDRVGDTIDPAAYHPYIGKRLPALFGHDHEKIIGTWENLRLDGTKLVGDLKLAATGLGKMVQELIAANVPLMNSIGFKATAAEPRKNARGMHFKQIDLYEASVVAVGAHPSAVMIAKSYGLDIESNAAKSVDKPVVDAERLLAVKLARKRAAKAIIAAKHTLKG